ncbi:MAG: nucleotidyltransferase domain-containing protein, partial [Methanosarcinales archaeon]
YIILDNLNVRVLRILFNLIRFTDFNFKKYPSVKGVGLYGSCARGENTEDSDIDVWIKIKTRDEDELAKLTGALKRISGKISPLYLTSEKLEVLKRTDKPFYNSLVYGSIKIYGEVIV